jgi:hypothetical protein
VCCQVDVTATGWLLVQRSATDYGVSQCDREDFIKWRPWPSRGCCATREKKIIYSECMRIALVTQHTQRMRRIILSPVTCLKVQNLFTLLIKVTIFGKKLLNTNCYVFLYNLVWNLSYSKSNSTWWHKRT